MATTRALEAVELHTALRPALSAAAVCMVLSACGSHNVDPAKRAACLIHAEDTVAMNQVVAKLYADGKMGKASAFKVRYFSNVPRAAYMQPDGRLKRYQDLQEPARTDAQKMINGHLRGYPFRYAGQIEAAMAHARAHLNC